MRLLNECLCDDSEEEKKLHYFAAKLSFAWMCSLLGLSGATQRRDPLASNLPCSLVPEHRKATLEVAEALLLVGIGLRGSKTPL